jgi:hypothetical protein
MNDITTAVGGPGRVLGALALELAYGSDVARDSVAQDQAGALAALVASDLAAFTADAAQLDCTLVAAHYDPVELLRPGWPLHQELWQLAARAPRAGIGGARVIAFGAHAGQLPGALSPSADFRGGPLRLLPFVLDGDAETVARVATRCEADLMEEGMAGAATALAVQEAFGLRVEHARYLTVHDLCAMTALQYGHAGLEPLWPLLETALLSPAHEAWLDAPPEPLLRYVDGEARMALFSPAAWRALYVTRSGAGDGAVTAAERTRLERGFAQFEARQRQFTSVLRAHGVPVSFAQVGAGDPRDAL